ncbi:MAG: hypothetical protein ACI4SG_01635 [Oligosphaeraceae bacterium]
MPRRLSPSRRGGQALTLHPEIREKRLRLQSLLRQYAGLLEEYEDWREHRAKSLQAQYHSLFGQLEFHLYLLQVECLRLRRKIALYQAAVNHGQAPRPQEVEKLLDQEFAAYQEEVKKRWEKLQEDEALLRSPRLSREEAEEFRSLYRALVKRLHPDLHPEIAAKSATLWNRIQEAYRNVDLPALRLLADTVEFFLQQCEVLPPPPPAELDDKIQKQEKKIQALENSLRELRSRPPFTYQELLEDEEKCRERRRQLEEMVKEQRQYRDDLTARLAAFPSP